jgi:hypothetical protein
MEREGVTDVVPEDGYEFFFNVGVPSSAPYSPAWRQQPAAWLIGHHITPHSSQRTASPPSSPSPIQL